MSARTETLIQFSHRDNSPSSDAHPLMTLISLCQNRILTCNETPHTSAIRCGYSSFIVKFIFEDNFGVIVSQLLNLPFFFRLLPLCLATTGNKLHMSIRRVRLINHRIWYFHELPKNYCNGKSSFACVGSQSCRISAELAAMSAAAQR